MSAVNLYQYKTALNCLLEIETESVRDYLPKNIIPQEIQHNLALLSIAAFEFENSDIGAYNEVVLSVVVAPKLIGGKELPRTALFPINVLTDTDLSKRHALDLYKLPHYAKNPLIQFGEKENCKTLEVQDEQICLRMALPFDGQSKPLSEYHQMFTSEGDLLYFTRVEFQGTFSENQNGNGRVHWIQHSMFREISMDTINEIPYLERIGTAGQQTLSRAVEIR